MSSEWKLLRLGDHCIKIGSGSTPTGGKDAYLETGPFTLIRSQNIYNEGFTPNGLAFIGDDQARKLIGVAVEKNDVLLNITGDSVARVCLAPSKYLPARVNQHVAIIRPKSNSFDSRYLRYFLASPQQQELMFGLASAGATRPALTKVMIENFKIPCPPMGIQIAIADMLSSLDDRIALLYETNATLEAISQALFKSWFVKFEPVHAKRRGQIPDGMDEATAVLFPDDFEESVSGLVPKGWKTDSLATLMDIAGGTQPPASEFIDSYQDGYIRLIQIRDYETDSHITFIPQTTKLRTTSSDDIMIARYGASVGRICWGLEGAYNVALVRVVCNVEHREYLRTYLMSSAFQLRLAAISGRSAQAGFNKDDIASFKLVVPSQDLFIAFQVLVWPLREKILHHRQQAKTLNSLRNALLPRLISGQLSVTEAEHAVEEVVA
jgi:type I restriction enzyme S subunit